MEERSLLARTQDGHTKLNLKRQKVLDIEASIWVASQIVSVTLATFKLDITDRVAATLVGQIDSLLDRIKWYCHQQHDAVDGKWEIDFHLYGKDQVSNLPHNLGQPSELFLVGEVLASSQALAYTIAYTAGVATTVGRPKSHNLLWRLTNEARSISWPESYVGQLWLRHRREKGY